MEAVPDIRTLVVRRLMAHRLGPIPLPAVAEVCILPFIVPYSSHGRSYVPVMKTTVVPVITPGLAWAVLRQTLSASANVDSAVQVSDSRSTGRSASAVKDRVREAAVCRQGAIRMRQIEISKSTICRRLAAVSLICTLAAAAPAAYCQAPS